MSAALGITVIAIVPDTSLSQTQKYYCAQLNGIYRTFVRTQRGNIPIIKWVSNEFDKSPRERCLEVSRRFVAFSDNGLLQKLYLRTDKVNNLPVICVTHSIKQTCPNGNILVTLGPNADAGATLYQLLDLRRRAADGGIPLSDDLVFYDQGEAYVDIDLWTEKLEKIDSQSFEKILFDN